jgi:hypothetical protein
LQATYLDIGGHTSHKPRNWDQICDMNDTRYNAEQAHREDGEYDNPLVPRQPRSPQYPSGQGNQDDIRNNIGCPRIHQSKSQDFGKKRNYS